MKDLKDAKDAFDKEVEEAINSIESEPLTWVDLAWGVGLMVVVFVVATFLAGLLGGIGLAFVKLGWWVASLVFNV